MRKRKLTWIYAAALVSLAALVFYALIYYVPKYLRQEYIQGFIAQKIYEVDFSYVAVWSEALICYMVCEPPDNRQDLIATITDFLTEDRLEELRVRAKEYIDALNEKQHTSYPLDGMTLIFLEPYEELAIGEFPETGDIWDYNPEGHSIAGAHVVIPLDGTLSIIPTERYSDSLQDYIEIPVR
jgi:hypothetical protein